MTQKWSILKRRTGRSWDYESSRWPRNGRFWREERAVSSYRRFSTPKGARRSGPFGVEKWRQQKGAILYIACHLGSGKFFFGHIVWLYLELLWIEARQSTIWGFVSSGVIGEMWIVRADFYSRLSIFFLASFLRARDLVKIGRSSAKSSCAHVNFEVCFLLPSAHSKPPGHRCGMSAAETLGV